MIPGVNPRQMQQMMRQMGMSQTELEAEQVVIKLKSGKQLVFENPNVQQIKMQGQETFQLMGTYSELEEKAQITISEDDVEMVAEQANVSKDKAKEALENNNGDIAEAIVSLTE